MALQESMLQNVHGGWFPDSFGCLNPFVGKPVSVYWPVISRGSEVQSMQTFQYAITDPEGMHVRPAGLLAKFAQSCTSRITMIYGGKSVDVKRLFAIMSLCVKSNDEVTFQVEGEHEAQECENLRAFCQKNL